MNYSNRKVMGLAPKNDLKQKCSLIQKQVENVHFKTRLENVILVETMRKTY